MSHKKLISREEVLGGLRGKPTKQANTLLGLIENRTALLVAQSQPQVGLILAETALAERNRAYLEAIAAGREPPVPPTIQQLERFAPQWALLAPDNPSIRAAVAHLLGQKYRFTAQTTPNIRQTLGLDTPEVQDAYRNLYQASLESIFAPRLGVVERLRWGWAGWANRLESLPPFWLTLALTLPGAAGLLALPIALAQVGLVTGLVLLIVFGLINLLTVTALAEAVARSGITRFGLGFLGQLMQEYLGQTGATFMTITLALNNFFVLIIFYIGVAGTLEDATSLPTEIWLAALFGVCLYFLSRKSLNTTIGATLIIIFVNILILLAIPLLALRHVQISNIAMVELPFTGEAVSRAATWQLIFGIMLSTYFSHLQIATYGQVVLRRDPDARAWIRGSAAAILVYMAICCLWLVTVNGAISPADLTAAAGTVLAPLAQKIGPIIHFLGSLLVILSLGLLSVQIALGLYYLVQERLPVRSTASFFSRLSERGRFWLAASPVAGVFLLAEWVSLTGFGTFASLLGILSALVLPLLGGIFPVLLLAATRRKGDFVPGVVYRFVGNSLVLAALYLFFLIVIFVHGLFIWETLFTRLIALLVGGGVLAGTMIMLRRGALTRRKVVELRDDQSLNGQPLFNITDSGQARTAEVQLSYPHETQIIKAASGPLAAFSRLQAVSFKLPATQAQELKVWAHQITSEGDSVSLPVVTTIHNGPEPKTLDPPANGQMTLPLDSGDCLVEIRFVETG